MTPLITSVPIVGFVMLFVWGFGSGTNQNKANFSKAALIWIAVWIALYTIFMMMFGAAMLSGLGDM